MIAFGCAITSVETYRHCAEPGIRRVAEPDSEILAYGAAGSIFRSYNLLLDQVADRDDLEALVLVHQDAEIVDPDFSRKIREALSDPDVALVGCAGGVGVRSIAWREGSVTWAGFTHRFEELGGGDVPALTWEVDEIPPYARTGEVEMIDGFVMAMSPWAVRELRFDESLGMLHGYDFDICQQARAAGRKVVVEDFRAIHYHSLEMISEVDSWVEAHMRLTEKWEDRLPDRGARGDWKQRARRAEAEASAARMLEYSSRLVSEARIQALEGYLDDLQRSPSWRITAPLRWLKRPFRRRGDVPEPALRTPGSLAERSPDLRT